VSPDPNLAIAKTFPGVAGTDELWYDPTTKKFYVTGNNGSNSSRFFAIISDDSAGGSLLQTVALPATASAHSITVDALNGDVFVPLAGTAALDPCPASFANPGCIAVFTPETAAAVPAPVAGAGLPGLLTGIGAMLAWFRKRRAAV